jgi:23S rRNA pseudouridine1911/1915/1917 synthase
VLFEDKHLIAVYKPANLLTQEDNSGRESLVDWVRAYLKEKYQKPGNVFIGLLHRLDREVSGVILFAKNSKSASRLSEQIRERSFQKEYLVLVEGKTDKKSNHWVHYLSSEAIPRIYVQNRPKDDLKKAELLIEKIGEWKKGDLLKVKLITGRKHQIRAQCSFMGNPILGDFRYGAKEPFHENQIALLSHKIGFFHPTEKEKWIEIEIPEDECPLKSYLI